MVNRIRKIGRYVGAIKEGYHDLMGKDLSKAVNKRAQTAVQGSYAKGGLVKTRGKKTAIIKAHAGEAVLSKKAVTMLKKMLK
jgi:hypothetical protein